MEHIHEASFPGPEFEIAVVITGIIAITLYYLAFAKLSSWPVYRFLLFVAGILATVTSLAGPLAGGAHESFTLHMVVHLLLGMLSPLLMVLSRPLKLMMKSLPVLKARRLSAFMRESSYIRFLHLPVTGAVLNIGGLYLLYMTGLFHQMHSSLILFILVHLHVFFAGYLFTHVILEMDFILHRYSFYHRAAVLILTLAGHKILSKIIYANPPEGISRTAGESGAMLMYYGGDVIDLLLIIFLCYQWYLDRQRLYAISTRPSHSL
ncbi:cytochrome c oxidase assembly protein [Jeotgalibacillus sp. JSM ZJ347]|uniref:cytochrome c oxidase assembly protein n=1 Tax=Jeotgalibacillus sp. JSM ZJ347 TaxID=3342117 RepID=UPI0035A92859